MITQIQNKIRERGALIVKAQAVQKKAHEEKRSLTDAEKQEFEGYFSDADKLEGEIRELKRTHDAQKRQEELEAEIRTAAGAAAAAAGAGSGSGGNPDELTAEQRTERENRAFAAYMIAGPGNLSPEARNILQPGDVDHQTIGSLPSELRAMVVGTSSAGGITVPVTTRDSIVEALKAHGGMRQAARILTTESGEQITQPTLDDTANEGALIGEATAVTETDLEFSNKQLNAYKYTTLLIKVSRELLQDSLADIPSVIGEAFATRIARITNRHYTTGDGSNKPQGLVPAISVAKQGSSATSVSVAELLDTQHGVDPAYRMRRSDRFVGWMFADDTLRAIRGLTGTEGQPLFQASFRMGDPDLILGYPFVVNQDVSNMTNSAKSILFGDFWPFVIRDVRALSIMRLNERYAEEDVVAFVGFMRTDSEYLMAPASGAQDSVRAFQNAA